MASSKVPDPSPVDEELAEAEMDELPEAEMDELPSDEPQPSLIAQALRDLAIGSLLRQEHFELWFLSTR